jgi:hypothetical protein
MLLDVDPVGMVRDKAGSRGGGPMVVQFNDIRIKEIKPEKKHYSATWRGGSADPPRGTGVRFIRRQIQEKAWRTPRTGV